MDSGSPLGTRLHFHTAPFYLARFIFLLALFAPI